MKRERNTNESVLFYTRECEGSDGRIPKKEYYCKTRESSFSCVLERFLFFLSSTIKPRRDASVVRQALKASTFFRTIYSNAFFASVTILSYIFDTFLRVLFISFFSLPFLP